VNASAPNKAAARRDGDGVLEGREISV